MKLFDFLEEDLEPEMLALFQKVVALHFTSAMKDQSASSMKTRVAGMIEQVLSNRSKGTRDDH